MSKRVLLFFLFNLLAGRCGYAELVVELTRKTILDMRRFRLKNRQFDRLKTSDEIDVRRYP